MIWILGAPLDLVGGIVAGLGLYLLALAIASIPRRAPAALPLSKPTSRLVVVVPAHDEELLVGRCVDSLMEQTYPRSLTRVVVIADNCTDQTAARALAAGAEVMVRDNATSRGKGQALRWAMDQLLAAEGSLDAMVVVDADSVADPELLIGLERELAAGHPVVQADYSILVERGSPRSAMVAAGFLLFHRVRFSGRARLGMAANLVGNGMLISATVLRAHPWDAFSGVEDLEYSIRLRLAGIQPYFAPTALVAGPGPASRAGLDRQRARWEGGRMNVVRRWLWRLVRTAIVRGDLRLLDAAVDLATPPLGLLCLATAGGATVATLAVIAGAAPASVLIPWTVSALAIPAYVVIGLWAAGAPSSTWRVALAAPGFLAWKVLTYSRLLRGFDAARWDRSDRTSVTLGDRRPYSRVEIAGIPIDTIDMSTALARLEEAIKARRLFQVSTVNLDFLVRAQRDAEVHQIFQRTDLNLADGAPVVWLGKLLGARMSGRVAGADLVPALLARSAHIGASDFLLGGEGGVAAAAAARLAERHPGLVVAGTYEPPRTSLEDMDHADLLARIAEARPDVLLVAFGHPKQERWIDFNRGRLQVSVAIGVGCVLDLIAGKSRRAPRWMQVAGLEWAYRLAQEPRRLMGRYLVDAAWLFPITARTLHARLMTRRSLEPA